MPYKDPIRAKECKERWKLANIVKVRESAKLRARMRRRGTLEPYVRPRQDPAVKRDKKKIWFKQWAARNQGKVKFRLWKFALKRKYGITVEEYNRLLEKQGNVCAICLKPSRAKYRLAVDHDHKTGLVRGLLCTPCNRVIGYLENKDWEIRARAYLEAHKEMSQFHNQPN